MLLCTLIAQPLAGESTRRFWIRRGRAGLVVAGQLDPLLVHSLGLHPLYETEEVFIRHRWGVGAGFWWGAALIVDPWGLTGNKKRIFVYMQERVYNKMNSWSESHLALYQHVEEIIAGFLAVALPNQMTQVVLRDPKTWKVANIYTLIIESTTLRALDEIEQLLGLRGSGKCRIYTTDIKKCSGKKQQELLQWNVLIKPYGLHLSRCSGLLRLPRLPRCSAAPRVGSAGHPCGCSGTCWGVRWSSLHRGVHSSASATAGKNTDISAQWSLSAARSTDVRDLQVKQLNLTDRPYELQDKDFNDRLLFCWSKIIVFSHERLQRSWRDWPRCWKWNKFRKIWTPERYSSFLDEILVKSLKWTC